MNVEPAQPVNITDANAFFQCGTRYQIREVYRYRLWNVFVGSIGAVYCPFSLLKKSVVEDKQSYNYSMWRFGKELFQKEIRFSLRGRYLAIFDHWSANNHYHCHVDLLPRLLLLSTEELRATTLLLPDTP